MRALLCALLSLCILPMALPVAAQGGATTQVLEDPPGDLAANVADTPQAVPESRFKALDLVSASVSEAVDSFTFSVRVASLDSPAEVPGVDDGIITLNFRHNDQQYEAVFVRGLGDQAYYWGYLLKYVPNGTEENFQRPLDVSADPATQSISTVIYRDELLDQAGAAPFPGRILDGFRAASVLRSSQGFANVNGVDPGTLYNVRDQMPNVGTGTTPFPIQLGLEQSGHAALWTSDPVRASNGEQATYVFNVTAQNTGTAQELFQVKAVSPPKDWQVMIPDSYLRIGAGETVQIPILVSTPFSHTHGVLTKFRVEMTSQADPQSIGRLDLGVRYFTIPQPGGHHNALYLHSTQFGSQSPLFQVFDKGFSGNSGSVSMNTLESDPTDAKVPITGQFYGYYCSQGCPPEVPHVEWRWWIFLQPGLEMGLDFDMDGEGLLRIPVQAQIPMTKAIFGGHLIHFYYDDAQAAWVQTIVADFAAPELDLMPGAPNVYSFPVKPRPAADFLPHAKRSYLGLILNLTSVRPSLFTGAEAPQIVPGGDMTLPLFEYRDPLQASFSTLGAVRLEAVGEHERFVNPGKSALFTARLTNDLDEEHVFDIAVTGAHADWARVLGTSKVTVAPRSAAELRIAVAVPATATDRDAADLVLTAQGEQPELHGIMRLVALVDLGHDHPDEATTVASFEQPQEKESPASQAALLGLGLLALAAVATRRKK